MLLCSLNLNLKYVLNLNIFFNLIINCFCNASFPEHDVLCKGCVYDCLFVNIEKCPYIFRIIRLCLSIWNRSPDAYAQLKESGVMKLPSGRLLSLYKNSITQKPGIQEEVLDWLVDEVKRSGLDDYGKAGGLILDEMSIQVS